MSELRFHRIRITPDAVQECEGTVVLVTIPRSEIRRIRLAHGVISEHPLFLLLLSGVCAAASIAGLVMLIHGGGFAKTAALLLALMIPVPWIIGAALRRGPLLEIETSRGKRKLGFGRAVALEALPEFVGSAKQLENVEIVADLPAAIVR